MGRRIVVVCDVCGAEAKHTYDLCSEHAGLIQRAIAKAKHVRGHRRRTGGALEELIESSPEIKKPAAGKREGK